MRTIVVGVDGSEEAQRALLWAMSEAHTRRCRVHAVLAYEVHTIANQLGSLVTPAVPLDLLEQQARGALETAIAAVAGDKSGASASEGGRAAPTLTHEVVTGHAGTALIEAASDAELLVVGRHGRSGLRRLHLGSTSDFCVHNARCPVVVVPPALRTGRR